MSRWFGAFRGTPTVVAALAAASVAILVWTTRLGEEQAVENLEFQGAIHRLEMAVATSHLWLEEYLTGDPSVDDKRIYTDLDEAIEVVEVLLDGEFDAVEMLDGVSLEDAGLKYQVDRLRTKLATFRDASHVRFQHGAAAGVGTDLDQSFDRTFEDLLGDTANLRARLTARMNVSRAATRMRLRLVLLVWGAMAMAAVWGLWTHERRRLCAEDDLRRREKELQQAQKMEAVGRLAGGIAHDINNYLGALRGHCEVAKLKGESGDALSVRMDRAVAIVTKASDLIRRLLAFSRRQPTLPKLVSLNRVVEGTREMIGHLLGDNVTLAVRLAEDLAATVIDPSQAEQILVNLLVNGRDAMPRGGTIVVTTANMASLDGSEERGFVKLSVTDTGSGIPDEIREKIFEPFFSTKPDGQSSGLGLATVYAIVQASGGRIDVHSKSGQGSTFDVLLPTSAGLIPDEGGAEHASSAQFDGIRVLLVEDDEAMRASTTELLEALGHEVEAATDGPEALAMLAGQVGTFDLMISDVVMPGMSGPEVLVAARVGEPGLGCLFISGYTDDVDLRQGLGLDRVSFLAKPFGAGSLSKAIFDLAG